MALPEPTQSDQIVTDRSLADTIAVVGAGATAQGELPGRSANAIAVEALRVGLADAGLSKHDLDGLITCKVFGTGAGIDTQIGALAGLDPAYSATLEFANESNGFLVPARQRVGRRHGEPEGRVDRGQPLG